MIQIIMTLTFLFLMITIGSMMGYKKTNNDRLNDRIDEYTKSQR